MMMGYHGFWGWMSIGLGIVIHVAFAAMVVLSAIWLYRKVSSTQREVKPSDSATEILKQRLAKGEISVEEYRALRQHLE